MTDEPSDQQKPALKLKLIKDAIRDAGLGESVSTGRQLTVTAKRCGACYRVGRRVFVTEAQLVAILEQHRFKKAIVGVTRAWLTSAKRKQSGLTQSPSARVLAQLEAMERDGKKPKK